MSRVGLRFGVVALAISQLAWLDPHHRAREGNRLYADGKYDEAATRYNEALVDAPDSPLLHFNLGDVAYRQGKFDDAVKAFGQVPAGDADSARTARVAYNIGNAKFRLGEAAESSDPKAALGLWAEALAAYRRALGADPEDDDARVNHELVEKRIADLRKKLEEEQKEEEQKQQEQQPQEQPPGDQQQAEEEQKDQQQPQDQQPPEQQERSPDQAQQPQQQQQEQQAKREEAQQPGAAAPQEAGEPGDLSKQEAAALLDSQRDQEVRPDEVVRKLQGAVLAEPAQDW